jgi:uncharacterized protein (TIGR00297 family)
MIMAGEGARVVLRLSPEFTRKFVHVSVGLLIFWAPWIFTSAVPALVLAALFVVMNLIAVRLGLFKSIHGTTRSTYGTVYYPLAFLILILLFWRTQPMILSLAMIVLALADAAAAIVGETVRRPLVYALSSDKKSLQGTVAYVLTATAVLTVGIQLYPSDVHLSFSSSLVVAAVAALVGAGWEALSSRGLDNLTVPLSTAFVLSCYLNPSLGVDAEQFTIGTVLAGAVAYGSYRARFLALSGSVATFLLAVVVFGVGGWKWTVPIVVFFVLSSLLSKLGKSRKAIAEAEQEKGSTRDYAQVLANGGIPGLLVLAWLLFPSENWYVAYLGAIAAVTADTWGTELGLLGRGRTVLITTFRHVSPGVNGGISVLGMVGGLIGASLIAASAAPFVDGTSMVALVVAAGLAGSLIDSAVGATLQAQFRCIVCAKGTRPPMIADCAGFRTMSSTGCVPPAERSPR